MFWTTDSATAAAWSLGLVLAWGEVASTPCNEISIEVWSFRGF